MPNRPLRLPSATLATVQNGRILARLFVQCKHLFAQALTRTPVRGSVIIELMFGQDRVQNAYPRPQRRRGYGRILILSAALVLATGRLAYGSGPVPADTVVVHPGDTIWSIAASRFAGDPRPHIDEILAANRLSSPTLTPGQTLRIPRE